MESRLLVPQARTQNSSLSHVESLCVVQIFLNAAIACIAHTRELIPWVSTCFQTRHINQLRTNTQDTASIYSDFCDGLAIPVSGPDSQEFRILRKGYDKRADCILDMIEGGIMAALSDGHLDAFQIIIAVDASDPASTLESYTFSFIYEEEKLTGVNVSPRDSETFLLKNVHRGFNTSIRALLRLLKDRPRLPRRRSLGISLLYKDKCPKDYQPPGFVDARMFQCEPIRGSWLDLWEEPPAPHVRFRCGNRTVTIGAQSLQFAGSTNCSRLRDATTSAQLRQMQIASSREPQLESTESLLPRIPKDINVNDSDRGDTDRELDQPTAVVGPDHNERSTRHSTAIALPNNGSVPLPSASQCGSKPKNPLAGLGVASKNRRRRNVVAGKLAELMVQARALENSQRPHKRLFDKLQLEIGRIRRLERSGPVQCDCGSDHQSETMLLCELCGTTQHRLCYGYEGLRPGCLPEEHFCYSCLLLPREDAVCQRMQGVVHMRLALLFLSRMTNAEIEIGQQFFGALFGRLHKTTVRRFRRLIDRLIREGYLKTVDHRTATIMNIGNKHMMDAADKYLDPLAGIIHHYKIVRDGDTYDSRKQETLKALGTYAGKRSFSFDDASNVAYDRLHTRNNSDQEVIRWGFYASWKRKEAEALEVSRLHKKLSVCNKFINVDTWTSSEIMSIDEALRQTVSEAEWDLRIGSRLSSTSSAFN